ncbi:hypothetical protein [Polyangium mundeleinium]|uniref:Uncharacterized protein n=1 Tax=Polyangium mundeleinium TaxID=2995306 RepID=A0ABT5ELR4_9BACT|nr:hypothetical protein [Polyangium mundeleinium]MDC0742785.1 hypothetical protein [Polyangium mundeleinium]
MIRFAIAAMLLLGLASASFTALAADDAAREDAADVERGLNTLRVISKLDRTCEIWVNGSLRATIGPFGNSGILATSPRSSVGRTEIMARCESAVYLEVVTETRRHCDLTIDPTVRGHDLLLGPCHD